MVHLREHNRDDASCNSSYFQKTVMLRDWWLIKCSKEFEGKRFGVAGSELMPSTERRAVRVFTSAPIVKVVDVWTLETSDGICILLKGLINKERTVNGGFSPEIFRHFVFGFPPRWKEISNKCFKGESSGGAGIDSVSLRIDTGNESLNAAKTVGAEKDDRDRVVDDLVSSEVDTTVQGEPSASQVDGFAKRHTGPASKEKKTRKCDTKESESLGRCRVEHKATRDSPCLLLKEYAKMTESGKRENSNKTAKSVKSDGKVKPLNHPKAKKNKDKENCVREEDSAGAKTKRRINFDVEVTPAKRARKQDTDFVSPDTLSIKRSRSGRLLVSTLEFWRNQVAVYDSDRKIIGIKGGFDATTPVRGKVGSESERHRRRI